MKNWQQLVIGLTAPGGRFSFTLGKMRRALGLLAVVLISTATLCAAPINAVVTSVSGSVEFAGPGSASFAPLNKGQTLAIGSTVRTGSDGIAVIVAAGSAVQLGNDSNLKINELQFTKSGSTVTERTTNLQLNSGVLSALVNQSTPKITNFKIQTPQGAAAARGTFYAVLVYNGKTYVGVKEGHVAASSGQ